MTNKLNIIQFDDDFIMTDTLPKTKYEKQLIQENISKNLNILNNNPYYIIFHNYELLKELTEYIHNIMIGNNIEHKKQFDDLLNDDLLDIFYTSKEQFNNLIDNKNILYQNRYNILQEFLKKYGD